MRIILLLLLIVPFLGFSQKKKNQRDTSVILTQPNRIEFEIANEGSNFFVVPGQEHGIMVVEATNKAATGGGLKWKIHLVDTAFQILWSQTLNVRVDGDLIGYEYFDGNFYLLFNKSRFRTQDLIVYQFQSGSPEFLTYEITTVFPIEIYHFESVGETLLIAGSANFRPVVITYNINDKIPRVVPGFYDNKSELLDLVVDEESEFFTVILSEKMRNKKFTVRVRTFTSKGDIIQDNLLNPGDKKSLLDAASTTFSNGLQYLAGTHSKKSLHYSHGLYLSKFVNGVQQFNQYYPFADLDNFFGHLKPKKEQRIRSRIERKKEKGKIKKFSYRLLVHEILQRDDEYIMIAEAYYPRYSYGSNGGAIFSPHGFGNFNNNYRAYNPYFLGYKFTHAVAVGFDRNCNIVWDHTFRIEDIESYSLEENVMVSTMDDKVVLSYLEENEIRSKVIKGSEIVEGRTFNPVKLSFAADEVKNKDPRVEGLERWYGDTLFAFGRQNIRNEHGIGGRVNRRVFYLNKIQFDLNREFN